MSSQSQAPRCAGYSAFGRVFAMASLALLALPAAAQFFDFDDEKNSWKEIEAKLPPAPKPGNLVQFEAGGASPHQFMIDADSVSIGKDGVVRYTLVVRTAGGATNVSFEGIRCFTREQKYYALGRSDGSWSPARDPQWRPIEYQDINRHHGVLYVDFLCDGKQTLRDTKEVLERLRYGTPPRY